MLIVSQVAFYIIMTYLILGAFVFVGLGIAFADQGALTSLLDRDHLLHSYA